MRMSSVAALDSFQIYRSPAGATPVWTNIFTVNGLGKTICTLNDGSVTNPMLGPNSVSLAKINPNSCYRAVGSTTYRYPVATNIVSTASVVILRGTIVSSGGLILIQIVNHGLFYPVVTGKQFADFEFYRNGAQIQTWICEAEIAANSFAIAYPISASWFVVDQAGAGTITYELGMRVSSPSCIYRTGTYAVGDLLIREIA